MSEEQTSSQFGGISVDEMYAIVGRLYTSVLVSAKKNDELSNNIGILKNRISELEQTNRDLSLQNLMKTNAEKTSVNKNGEQ